MDFWGWSNHFFNFIAPVLTLALLLPVLARWVVFKKAASYGWASQVAVNAVVGAVVLVLGLWWCGHDGKVVTYGALVVVVSTSQWVLSRGWR